MTIKNFKKLARGKNRKLALEIVESAYKAIDTSRVLENKIKKEGSQLKIEDSKIKLENFNNIYFIGIGKSSLRTAEFFDKLMGKRIKQGVYIDVKRGNLKNIESIKGTHPLPSKTNIRAAEKIAEIINQAGKEDLIITCTSGGGSALLSLPEKLSLKELKKLNNALLKSGADIYEINTVRKHISKIKGGQLAKMAYPAKVVNLLFSDVPGDDPAFIASGPFIKDETSIKEAEKIKQKYKLPEVKFYPTPKKNKYFKNIENHMLVSGKKALKAMERKCRKLKLQPIVFSDKLQGEARIIGKKITQQSQQLDKDSALLACGETTVTVQGEGKGGRNQEIVLGATSHLEKNQVIISAASDGRDNSEAAGAIADGQTALRARKLGLDINDHLKRNDAFHFFAKLNDLLKTGKTGANVADFVVCINRQN